MRRARTSRTATRPRRLRATALTLLPALSSLLWTAAPASAGIHTWVGGGSNGNWSDASKWDGGIPGFDSGEQRPIIVRFDTATVSTMNISGLAVDEIRFLGSGNVINGTGSQTLGLLGTQISPNITSGASGNRIASTLPISLGGQLVTVNSASGFLTLEGPITGGPNTALKFLAQSTTAGTTVTGSIATGKTLVASGELGLDSPGAVALQSPIVQVGEGGSEGATLRAFRAGELLPTADVFVDDDGTYDLGINVQAAVDTLTIDRGTVNVGGYLGVTGGLSASGGAVSGAGILGLIGDVTLGSTSSGAPAAISTRIELEGERTFTINDGPAATDAIVSGVAEDALGVIGSLAKTGAGTLRLNPSASNTYTGLTKVLNGTLELKATSGRAIPTGTTLRIGDFVGPVSSASVVELINNDIDSTTPVVVGSDGRLAMGGFSDTIASLQNSGVVDLPGASVLSVVGDTSVSSRVTGNGRLTLGTGGPSTLTLPSTPVGPPRVEAEIQLFSATEIFVTQGITAELAGGFGPASNNASPTVTKTGFGTLLLADEPANGENGLTTISQGTLIANGGIGSAGVTVSAGATLAGSGRVGAVTVAAGVGGAVGGTVAPGAPGLTASTALGMTASSVTFQAGGRLRSQIPASGSVPTLNVAGAVTIDPAAIVELPLAPGATRATAPTQLGVITKTTPGPISGRFANVAEGAELTPGPGLGYTFGYGAGDGNDLVGQLRNAAPVVTIPGLLAGAVILTEFGRPLGFSASATDADGDPLIFTWEFGDGGTAAGASVSHVYGADAVGERTAKVTVSDGRVSATATIPVNVTLPKAPPVQEVTPGIQPPGDQPPAAKPLADTTAPVLTFTIAKGQKLSKTGTINAQLRCSEACTITLATSIKPPGKKSRTRAGTATIQLQGGKPATVPVAVPKLALAAVKGGIKAKLKSTLTVSATARDAAGNVAKPIQLKASLRR